VNRTLEGTLTLEDQAASPFFYLPFEVPDGITRIDVCYEFEPGNILDIGIFDPRDQGFPSKEGFRGWSGSKRRSFFVAKDDATPGYLPGEMSPGTWRIILGLARIAPKGCRYRVEILLDDAKRPLIAPPPARPVRRPHPGWYKGDLQSHTHHSDANGSLEDLASAARSRGLDFLAVTDHNTWSHHRYLAELSTQNLLLVPGEEVTTYRGHANVWGVRGWVDFRIAQDAQLEPLVEDVHARGGLFSVNHPKALEGCLGCNWEYPVPEGADCFEAWQGPWPHQNWEALERYDALLRQGRRLTLVGGSDRHQPGWPDPDPAILQVGSPTTWVYLQELSVPALLDGLRSGRACVSESPEGPRLEIFLAGWPMGSTVTNAGSLIAKAHVTGARGERLSWVTAKGTCRTVMITEDPFADVWEWTPDGPFIRAEVVASAPAESVAVEARKLAGAGRPPRKGKGIDVEEIVRRPLLRALANPVYIDARG
jgi:hypothetical protein